MTTVLEALAGVAAQHVAEFVDGRNGRVRGQHIVHAVVLEHWLGEIRVPAPACHVGIGSWDLGALVATTDEVTCARCLHAGATRSNLDGPRQLPLWAPDPDPPHPPDGAPTP